MSWRNGLLARPPPNKSVKYDRPGKCSRQDYKDLDILKEKKLWIPFD